VLGEAPNQEEESERKELGNILDSGAPEYHLARGTHPAHVLWAQFSRQFTLEEIGQELKLTRERVRLIATGRCASSSATRPAGTSFFPS